MFDSVPQGHFLRGAPGVHDQAFQLYISMLEGLIVDRWSAAEHLLSFSVSAGYFTENFFATGKRIRKNGFQHQ